MNQLWITLIVFGLIFLGINAQAQTGENVHVRSGINHNEYDQLLKKYVNEQGLVNYGAWKQNAADLSALDEYLHQFAVKTDNASQGNEKAASQPGAIAFRQHFQVIANSKVGAPRRASTAVA